MFRISEEKNQQLKEDLEMVNLENLNLHQKLETSLKETLALVEEKASLLSGSDLILTCRDKIVNNIIYTRMLV